MSARRGLVMGSGKELGSVRVVAGLCGAYAAILLMFSSFLATVAESTGGLLGAILDTVTGAFVGIALYVSIIVMANAVATVLAGRLRHLALLRLLGSEASELRRSIRNTTAYVAFGGAAVGVVVGTAISAVARHILVAMGTMPKADYAWVRPALLVAIAVIVAGSLLAGWLGSRTVLSVTPAQAMAGAVVTEAEARGVSVFRSLTAVVTVIGGAALLWLAMASGEDGSSAAFLIAFFGAATLGTGLLIGARSVIPGSVAAFSRVLGTAPAAKIARRNALRDPLRTTRSTMGLVVGVCLITSFAAGFDALRTSVLALETSAASAAAVRQILTMTESVLICIVLISAIIATVGFSSTMTMTVVQRRRELGLLRALGFTKRQLGSMITMESIALSVTAVLLGVGLGVLFGSAAAQSLVGQTTDGFVWGLPWVWLGVISLIGTALVLATSRAASRPAMNQSPVDALAQS